MANRALCSRKVLTSFSTGPKLEVSITSSVGLGELGCGVFRVQAPCVLPLLWPLPELSGIVQCAFELGGGEEVKLQVYSKWDGGD